MYCKSCEAGPTMKWYTDTLVFYMNSGAPGEITRAAPSPLRGRRHFATTLSRAVYGARLELPTAWFVVSKPIANIMIINID